MCRNTADYSVPRLAGSFLSTRRELGPLIFAPSAAGRTVDPDMRRSVLLLAALVAAASALQAQPKPGLGPSRPGLLNLRGGASLKEETSLKGAPPFVKACASFSAMDSLLLGYDIGCISGILLFVQEEFALNSHQVEVFASAMNSAALVGALFSGYIADKFGRKPALFMSSCTFALGSILMAVATSYDMLVYSRYIQGFGVGAGLLISPMFISEVAPKQWPGLGLGLGLG